MLPIVASALVALSMAGDASGECLTELGYAEVPTRGSHVFLYRRCLSTKRKEVEHQKRVDADMQRMDQNFWMRMEASNRKREALLKTKNKSVLTRQQNASNLQDPHSRRSIIQDAARSVKRARRQLEKESD